MIIELNTAIQALYEIFSEYPLRDRIEGCPCCVFDADKLKIHSKALRELNDEDLSKYSFKAITTWGNVDDFKHYLPRIFELLATTDFSVDALIVLGKLDYGNWQQWNESEKSAIRNFLLSWWSDLIRNKQGFDKEIFLEINKLTGNVDELLSLWKMDFQDHSFANLVNLLYHYYNDLTGKQKEFKEMDRIELDKLKHWLKGQGTILEKGFFHFSNSDPNLAERISIVQSMLEH